MAPSLPGHGAGRELYPLFARAGRNALRAAELLERLLGSWPDEQALRGDILLCEQEGDRITHDILALLHTGSSRLPLEPDDVLRLATGVDDVVDYTEEVADFLGLYRIEAPMEQAQDLSRVLAEACRNLSDALARMGDTVGLEPFLLQIDRLEDEGDRITREALRSLFAGGIDPILLIRWKDLFERLEDAVDSCDQTSKVLGGIVVKRGG